MDWFEAARTGDLDTLFICLFWGQPVDRRRADDGRAALCIAAAHGHAAAVKLLLEHRADPNAAAHDGERPLTAAIAGEHWDIATALLRAGADPNADGVASFVIAEPPKRQLLALMLSRGLDPHGAHPHWGPYVHFALNDPACWDMFLGAGFDVKRWERDTGESLLERALSAGTDRFLNLLSLGANLDLPVDSEGGRTMLMCLAAHEAGDARQAHSLIQVLVKRGADLERRDAAGLTALDHARARGNKATAKLLTRLRAAEARRAKAQAKAGAAAEAKQAKAAREQKQRRARPQRGNTAEQDPVPKSSPERPIRSAATQPE